MRQSTYVRSILTRTALAGGLVLALGGAVNAQGADKALLERVESLEDTIRALQAELASVKAAAQAAQAQTGAAAAQAQTQVQAGAVKADFKGGAPTLTSTDGNFSIKLRGRVEIDTAVYNVREGDAAAFRNGIEARRARLGVEGTLYKDWAYRLEADIAKASRSDSGSGEVDVKDAYVQYKGVRNTKITFGQHKTPNSLELLTSSTQLTFLERPLAVGAFLDRTSGIGDFKPGLSIAYGGQNWTLTGGVFGENLAVVGTAAGDEGIGINGRATYAPVNETGRIVHLGLSGGWRDVGTAGVRFRDRPEVTVNAALPGGRLVDTGGIAADDYHLVGLELAGVYDGLFVQGEYLRTSVNRTGDLGNVTFDGGYVAVSYLLTGETRGYKDGLFNKVSPRRNFSLKDGGWGAFEVAGRFSTIDLDDENILGGKEDNYTFGLNWYFNPNVRTSFNWVRFDADRAGVETRGDAFAVRVGVSW